MALDFRAIISNGTYPTPTPTDTQRASYAISYGLLGVMPEGDIATGLLRQIYRVGLLGFQWLEHRFVGGK